MATVLFQLCFTDMSREKNSTQVSSLQNWIENIELLTAIWQVSAKFTKKFHHCVLSVPKNKLWLTISITIKAQSEDKKTNNILNK